MIAPLDADEGTLDPWVEEWLLQQFGTTKAVLAQAVQAGTLPEFPAPPVRDIASISDQTVGGVPIRTYAQPAMPSGLVVLFHGGGFCTGSIDSMDGIARELRHHSGAVVISVGYRLAPEHPYPAAVDDCDAVTRWVLERARDFDFEPAKVAVVGGSAGGSLAAAVTFRLRDAPAAHPLVGQVLLYPFLEGDHDDHESRQQFDGLITSTATLGDNWRSYSSGRDLDGEATALPLRAETLADLPPALIIIGGSDPLRDEGRAYAERLQADGVTTELVCYPGQPHGFMNFMFPAATDAFERTGAWLRDRFA
jgi:acetyl esterase